MEITVLSSELVARLATPGVAREAMRSAFGQLSGGQAVVPVRGDVHSRLGTTLLMPAWLEATEGLGAKIVSVFPHNAQAGVPAVQGCVVVLDPKTGALRGLVDGTELTSIRTAAGSALATEILADPEASVLTVFGGGPQARAHVVALRDVRRVREIRVVTRTPESARRFVAWWEARRDGQSGDLGPASVRVESDPDAAVEAADLVVTATTSDTPLFAAGALRRGTHINAVGAYRPDTRELDTETVRRARVVVDQREAVWEEAGELIIPRDEGAIEEDHVFAELGELLGTDPPGLGPSEDWSVFKSVGNAAQDVALASRLLELAESRGLGDRVRF